MAVNVYASDNYIIINDGTNESEYAKGYTVYTFKNDIFTIKETVGGEYKITIDQINDGDILDELNNPYDNSTFTTFLRQNTGFKTASGGSGAAPVGAKLLKTGQVTSYRTGDDGDVEAGRSVDFLTLAANNPFGNTNRFTDELGGTTYTNNIVIDWSTYNGTDVLGYYRNINGANVDWNGAVDGAAALSIGSFTSGWRLPNRMEFNNILNDSQTYPLNYAPFINFTISYTYWCSTSLHVAPASYAYRYMTYNLDPVQLKTASVNCRFFAVRNFTVSGTTLS